MDVESPLINQSRPAGARKGKSNQNRVVWTLVGLAALFLVVILLPHSQPSAESLSSQDSNSDPSDDTSDDTSDDASNAASNATPKVKVEVYGMAGCPYTRAFLEGPMSEMLSIVSGYVEVTFVPFGNSYYTTPQCGGAIDNYPFASAYKGYDADVMACWDKLCGASAKQPPSDCFKGDFVCQHGTSDGMVTTAWACAKQMTNDSIQAYWPFVTCTATQFLSITSVEIFRDVIERCSNTASLDPGKMMDCASGPGGLELLNAQARLTIPHDGVPFVLVEGQELDDTGCVACGDGIMQKVCEALKHKGVETPICQGIFGLS